MSSEHERAAELASSMSAFDGARLRFYRSEAGDKVVPEIRMTARPPNSPERTGSFSDVRRTSRVLKGLDHYKWRYAVRVRPFLGFLYEIFAKFSEATNASAICGFRGQVLFL
jgi:hypothetical protein